MARLIPVLILFFCFSLLLSSSHAGSSPATFSEEDVSDVKQLIVLPTEEALKSDKTDVVPLVNGEINRPEDSGKFTIEFQDKTEVKPIDDGEKKKLEEFLPTAVLRPIHRRFDRLPAFRCRHRHRGPRFDGGPQIWPRMPFHEEEDEHHRHHHGEAGSGRKFDGPRLREVDPASFGGDGRMIGEFKQPHFFFRRHHHHHHGDEEEEDQFHHDEEEREHHHRHHHHHGDDGEEDMEHHHKHRRGHGFWKTVRKFLGDF